MSQNDFRNPGFDSKYKNIPLNALPKGESLKDTVDRVTPFWQNTIAR
jgi:2,3-bisphosphoglycerate-dependent phosphoglycerate mutase